MKVAREGNTGIAPATVRPCLLAHDDWSAEYGRWWSNPIAYELTAGSTTLTVPLTSDAWSDVNGRFGNYDAATAAAFNDAITHMTKVGLTFAGGCFFGHGVRCRTAQPTSISLTMRCGSDYWVFEPTSQR